MSNKHYKTITRPVNPRIKPKTHKPRTLRAEKEYRRLKKLLTHKSEEIANTLHVSFSQPPETYGWIYLTAETDLHKVKISCSYAFEPFDAFIRWIQNIRYKQLLQPAWEIDEEGHSKMLSVYAVDDRYVRLVILTDDHYDGNVCQYKQEDIILDTIVLKEEFIAQFYFAFKNFVLKEFDQTRWSDENLYETLRRTEKAFECNWEHWRWID